VEEGMKLKWLPYIQVERSDSKGSKHSTLAVDEDPACACKM